MKKSFLIVFSIYLFGLIILFVCCDPADNRLKITNNSNSGVYFFYTCDSSLFNFELLNYFNSREDINNLIPDGFVQADSFRNIPMKGFNSWSHYIRHCPNKSINFYFLVDSIIFKRADSGLIANKILHKHINLTISEIKQRDWTLTFP